MCGFHLGEMTCEGAREGPEGGATFLSTVYGAIGFCWDFNKTLDESKKADQSRVIWVFSQPSWPGFNKPIQSVSLESVLGYPCSTVSNRKPRTRLLHQCLLSRASNRPESSTAVRVGSVDFDPRRTRCYSIEYLFFPPANNLPRLQLQELT